MALIAVAGVVALCGCGGSEGTAEGGTTQSGEAGNANDNPFGHSPPNAPSKVAFVEKANAICTRGKARASRAMTAHLGQQGASSTPDAQATLEAIQAVYPSEIHRQIKEINALEPPENEDWQVKAFVVALWEGIHSERRTEINPKFAQSFEHSARIARELGIDACVYISPQEAGR